MWARRVNRKMMTLKELGAHSGRSAHRSVVLACFHPHGGKRGAGSQSQSQSRRRVAIRRRHYVGSLGFLSSGKPPSTGPCFFCRQLCSSPSFNIAAPGERSRQGHATFPRLPITTQLCVGNPKVGGETRHYP